MNYEIESVEIKLKNIIYNWNIFIKMSKKCRCGKQANFGNPTDIQPIVVYISRFYIQIQI